jgi:hypothetical protein
MASLGTGKASLKSALELSGRHLPRSMPISSPYHVFFLIDNFVMNTVAAA